MTTAAAPLDPPTVEEPTGDIAPDKPKRRRSGTSGAERARRAKANGAAPVDKKPRAPQQRTRAPRLGPRIEAAHVVVGGVFAHATPLRQTGAQLAKVAGPAGDFWEQAAAQNPRIREIWERFLTTGLMMQGLAIYAPVVVVMLGELRVIPPAMAAGLVGAMGGMAPAPAAAPGSAPPVNVVDLPPRDA